MRYYIKSKLFKFKEDFWVKNDNEQDVYFIDKEFFSLGLQFRVLENNSVRYKVREKLLKFMPCYEIYDENDYAIAYVRKEFTFFSDRIVVESNYGDFEIEGDVFHYNYRIKQNGRVIADINKEFLAFTDNYYVDSNYENSPFIITLVIIIDNIIDKRRNN